MNISLDTRSGEFEERDLHYIRLLESDSAFAELVNNARREISSVIKPDTKPNEKLLPDYSPKAHSMAVAHAEKIVDIYRLPTSWINSISAFIKHGKFPSPGPGIGMSGLAYKITSKGKMPVSFTITVTQKTSFDTLRRWLNKMKPSIEKHLKQLPVQNTALRANTNIRFEIMQLHSLGYKPKKIFEELYEEHPQEGDIIPTTTEISNIIYSLKKKLQRNPQ